ncbi:MAG: hypothetical protein GY868_02875 [Deltaproteobacteria bacterium]|nr:hypothetical protein [Deltaproteobacteria bacterium]
MSARSGATAAQENVTDLSRRARLLQQQTGEQQRRQLIIKQTKSFVEQSEALGLTRQRWEVYKVDIQKTATLTELNQLLSQCAGTPEYYFKPAVLKIAVETPAAAPAQQASSQYREPTIALTLQGAFYNRR